MRENDKLEMVKDWEEVIKYICHEYGIIGILLLLLILAISYTEKTQVIVGSVKHYLAILFSCLKKSSTKDRLQGSCNLALKQIAKDYPDFSLPKMKIDWVKEDKINAILESGEAIVKLKYSEDHSQNIVNAMSVYVKKSIIPKAKPYISPEIVSAIDLTIVRKVLKQVDSKYPNAFEYFIENNKEEIKSEYISTIKQIDDAGFFTRILLKEFDRFGNVLYGNFPNEEYQNEANKFVDYVYNISTRGYEDQTILQFNGSTIKVGVVLVARPETYHEYGVSAYLRRIKLGRAKGIDTFYLLARAEKVDILRDVVKKLLELDGFEVANNPKVYNDDKGRDCICYCLKVDNESVTTRAITSIMTAIEHDTTLNAIVTKVRPDGLKVNIDGIEGFIAKNGITSDSHQIKVSDYFYNDMTICLKPIEFNEIGIVECTLIETHSDPRTYISANYGIGNTVTCTVEEAFDNHVLFNINNGNIQGYARRYDLTWSKFSFLHELYPIGSEHDMNITSISYENKQLHLQRQNLVDPWTKMHFNKGDNISFLICDIREDRFVGETSENINIVLKFSELDWLKANIENVKRTIRRNQNVNCYVKFIDYEHKIIHATLQSYENNPYIANLQSVMDSTVRAKVLKTLDSGVILSTSDNLEIFVPKSELSWESRSSNIKTNKVYKVKITSVSKYQNSYMGSLKRVFPSPLSIFAEKYALGDIVERPSIKQIEEACVTVSIHIDKTEYNILIFKGDITKLGFVSNLKEVFYNIKKIPHIIIKNIDYDNNKIVGSIRTLLSRNANNSESLLDYQEKYDAIIISQTNNQYVILIESLWLDAILESSAVYQIGATIIVRPTLISNNGSIFTEYKFGIVPDL